MVPSAFIPVVRSMRAGWRVTVAAIDSSGVNASFTGRPVRREASAASGSSEASRLFLSPKVAPSASGGWMRTVSGSVVRASARASRKWNIESRWVHTSRRSPRQWHTQARGSMVWAHWRWVA